MGIKKTAGQPASKKPMRTMNVDPAVHARLFDRIEREKKRENQPTLSAQNFIVKLLNMYDDAFPVPGTKATGE